MAYLKAYIGAAYSHGWEGGPEFKTRIVDMANGRDRRNAEWAQPRHRFTLGFQHLNAESYASIKQMHLVARGMLHTFLHQDGLDPSATDELFGLGDGVEDEFQLSKLSVVSGVTYQRFVYALFVPGDNGIATDAPITVTINGEPTTAFTLDRDRGLIVFDDPPEVDAVLRWSGPYSLWVRFAQDWLPFSFDEPNGRYGTVDLLEDKAPPEVTP